MLSFASTIVKFSRLKVFWLSGILFLPLLAQAIGDSGGSGACSGHDEWFSALQAGGREQLIAAFENEISPQPPSTVLGRLFGQPKAPAISPKLRAVRLTSLASDGPCPGGLAPINYTVAAGNPVATAYLLENGADPSALRYDGSIYHRCNAQLYAGSQPPLSDPRRLAAYRLTMERGGLVNYKNRQDETALHICHSLPFLQLLVEQGAELDSTHLDRALDDALRVSRSTPQAQNLNAYARIKFFVSRGVSPTPAMQQKLDDPKCSPAPANRTAVCAELNSLLHRGKAR